MGPKRDREVNIFNVSMLDVITGALGAFLILTALSVPFLPAKQLEAELDKAQNAVVELSSTLVKLTEPNTLNTEQSAEDVRAAFLAAQADLTERQTRIENLQADLNLALETNNETVDLQTENRELRSQIAELSNIQAELAEKTVALERVQSELSALALQVPAPVEPVIETPVETVVEAVAETNSATLAELSANNTQLNNLLANSLKNEEALNEQLQSLQAELQERSNTLTQLESELQVVELRLADALLKVPETADIITPEVKAALELELAAQTESINALQSQLSELSNVSTENIALQQELERLKSINEATLASSTDQNALQQELATLSATFAELERTKLSLEASLQTVQNELNTTVADRDTLALSVAQLQENYTNAEASRVAQERELTDLRLQNQTLQSQSSTVSASSQQATQLASSLQAQLDQSQALVTQLSQERQQVDGRLGELERERDILSAQIASTQLQAQENQTLNASLASLATERDALQAQVQRAATDVASYSQTLADRQATIDSLQAQLNQLSLQASQASTAQTQIQSYQQQNSDLTQRLAQLETSLAQLSAERDALQRESASLQTSLQQSAATAAAATAAAAAANATMAAPAATNSLFAMISWDKPADVDLTVIDPNGLNFNAADSTAYRQDPASGAEILIDSQRGPGSEIWYTPTIRPGIYKVRANIYAPRLSGDDEPIPVNINIVHQNNGRRATAMAVDLQYFTKNCMEVAHINVSSNAQLSISQVMQPCGAKEDNTPKEYLQGIDNNVGN